MRLNFKFLQTDGVPLTADLMDVLQQAYSIFNVIGDIAGNLTILSGCEITGTLVSPGIVAINGDVLYFEAGTVSDNVFIYKEDIAKIFKNQQSKILIEKKTVKFGDASEVYPWSGFVRISTLKEMDESLINFQSEIDDLQNFFDALLASFNTHVSNKNNPHQVTAQQVGILRKGTIYIGDVQGKNIGWSYNGSDYTVELIGRGSNSPTNGGDDVYRVTFNSVLPTANYIIVGSLIFNSNWNGDNDIIVSFGNKNAQSFELAMREVSSQIQNVSVDYIIIQN